DCHGPSSRSEKPGENSSPLTRAKPGGGEPPPPAPPGDARRGRCRVAALTGGEAGVEEARQALARGRRLLGLLPDALEVERSVQREVAESEVDIPHPHPRPGEAQRADEQDGIEHPEAEQRAARDRRVEPGRPEGGVLPEEPPLAGEEPDP